MKVTVCIGSSCHIKGSRRIIDTFKSLAEENGVADKYELCGSFCTGNCREGVCVNVDGKFFFVTPDTAEEFFKKEVLGKIV